MTPRRPKALESLIAQEPCVVLSTTDDPRANYDEPPDHLVLMVEDRDAIVAYVEALETGLEEIVGRGTA